jgi:hypothetical protein
VSARGDRVIAALLAAFTLAVLAALAGSGVRLTQDDGFYYFKIAQNLAAGRGSTFDGLHPTNGYHPLWLLVLTVLFALQPDPARALVAGALLQALLSAAAAALVYAAARLTLGRAGALAAALCWFGLTYSVALSGVEFALHALLLAACACLFVRAATRGSWSHGTAAGLGILLALLTLARLDGALLAVLIAGTVLLRVRGRGAAPWLLLAPTLAALGAYAAVNADAFGLPFPISGVVKRSWSAYLVAHDPWSARGGWLAAKAAHAAWPFTHAGGWPLRALLAGGLGAAALALLPWERPALLAAWKAQVLRPWAPFVAFAAAQYAAYLLLYHGLYSFTRWYYVAQPLLAALLLGAALEWLGGGAAAPRWRRVLPVLACVALALATLRGVLRLRQEQAGVREGPLHRAAAWARTHLPPDARVGTWNAGIIGYLSQRQVVNLDGLVNTRAYFEREQYDQCAYWERTGIGYLVDVFQPGTAVMDGATLPVGSYYAACAGRLELLWQDGAPGDPGWPKAYRFRGGAR